MHNSQTKDKLLYIYVKVGVPLNDKPHSHSHPPKKQTTAKKTTPKQPTNKQTDKNGGLLHLLTLSRHGAQYCGYGGQITEGKNGLNLWFLKHFHSLKACTMKQLFASKTSFFLLSESVDSNGSILWLSLELAALTAYYTADPHRYPRFL